MRIKDLFCTQDEINNYIKSCLENGSAFIGGYSVVVPIGDNLVLKRYDDRAYKLFISYAMDNPNCHCPVIYDHIFYEEFYPYGQGYVLMERLYPISDNKIATTNMDAESQGYWGKDDSVWIGETTCEVECLSIQEFNKTMRKVGVNNFNLDLSALKVDTPKSIYKEVVYSC